MGTLIYSLKQVLSDHMPYGHLLRGMLKFSTMPQVNSALMYSLSVSYVLDPI